MLVGSVCKEVLTLPYVAVDDLESVFLEVRESNVPARNLYHSYGFSEIGERKNYYRDPIENAIIMFKGNMTQI